MGLNVNIQENLMEPCGKVADAAERETFQFCFDYFSAFFVKRNMLI